MIENDIWSRVAPSHNCPVLGVGFRTLREYSRFCVSHSAQEGLTMMQGFDGMGMGWGMGLFGLLILVFLVLAIAALIKYLRS